MSKQPANFRCGHPRLPENTASHKRSSGTQYNECRTCKHARVKRWKQRCREKYLAAARRYNRKHRRGWTETDYRTAVKLQGGLCAICEQPGRLFPDHDHNRPLGQGRRALLCLACNTALGNFEDSPARLVRAAEYLMNYGRPWDGKETAA